MADIKKMIAAANNSNAFISLKKYYSQLSMLQISGKARDELSHSRFIAWLLNPESNHLLGFYPAKKFMQMIAVAMEESSDYEEQYGGNQYIEPA